MASKKGMSEFNSLMKKVGHELLATIKTNLKKTAWKRAWLDVRSQDGMRSKKFRVELVGGKVECLDEPMAVNMLLMQIWSIKDALFPEKWHGVKILLDPTGKCETEFNYDPNCFNDPTFFDS